MLYLPAVLAVVTVLAGLLSEGSFWP